MNKSFIILFICILLCTLAVGDFETESTQKQYHWIHTETILASDGITGDYFGSTIAHQNDSLFIGAPGDDDAGQWSGSVYVYKKSDQGWKQHQKLVASDAKKQQRFGSSISTNGSMILIGAPGDNSNGESSGAAYLFEKRNKTWIQSNKFTASNPHPFQYFGISVCLQQQTALIGAPGDHTNGAWAGAIYLFEKKSDSWKQILKSIPTQVSPGDTFGTSLSLKDTVFAVGAPSNNNDNLPGAVYIYTKTVSKTFADQYEWKLLARISSPSSGNEDNFGKTIAMNHQYLAIGAPSDNEYGDRSGAVYLFNRNENTLAFQEKIISPYNDSKQFGSTLDLYQQNLLIGTPGRNRSESGHIHLFTQNQSQWMNQNTIHPTPSSIISDFGASLAMNETSIFAGAPSDTEKGNNSGSVYQYTAIDDTDPPQILLTKPDDGLYLQGRYILSLPISIYIGETPIQLIATDTLSGVKTIQLFIDDTMVYQSNSTSVNWIYQNQSFGKQVLTIVAIDHDGNTASIEKEFFKIF